MLTMFAVIAGVSSFAQEAIQPAQRSAEEARRDACIYMAADQRDADCQALVIAEAALVPDEAFATSRPSSLGWADIACSPDRLAPDQSRATCRREQQGLFRRAERARSGMAVAPTQPGGLSDTERDWGFNLSNARPDFDDAVATTRADEHEEDLRDQQRRRCEREGSTWRDEDRGTSASSYSVNCMWGSGNPETERAARDALERIMRDD